MVLKEKPHAEALPAVGSAGVIVNGRYLPPPQDKDGKLWVRTSTLVQADPDSAYRIWRDIENAPSWQEGLSEVIRTGERTSHWVMRSGEKRIEWDSEILADEPGRRIAWRSTAGEPENAGEVIFDAAPGHRGTIVTVLQEFRMSRLASLWETITRRNPKQLVIENVRHFKALVETGEIPRSQGQSHGPRGAVGEAKESAYGEKIATPVGNRKAS